MKISSSFLTALALIALISIPLVISIPLKQPTASPEKRLIESVFKCSIANGVTTAIYKNKFVGPTLFCTIVSSIFYEEGKNLVEDTLDEIIWTFLTETLFKFFGEKGDTPREFFKKIVRGIWRFEKK